MFALRTRGNRREAWSGRRNAGAATERVCKGLLEKVETWEAENERARQRNKSVQLLPFIRCLKGSLSMSGMQSGGRCHGRRRGGSGASAAIDAVVRTSDSECKTVTTLVQSQLEPLQAERAARRAAASSSFAEARPP
jgi:hypothetical protein